MTFLLGLDTPPMEAKTTAVLRDGDGWHRDETRRWLDQAQGALDGITGGRFRHGTMLLRWRPDKSPRQCTREQIGEKMRPGQPVGTVL